MASANRRSGSGDGGSPPEEQPGGRRAGLRPEHGALAGVLALSCALEFNDLSQNGFANIYYSAAVKSMLRSFHNFFFVSFDPGGLVSVDKPPLGLWLEALSAKIFGFAPLPLLIPEGICAVLAVAAIYFIVAPRFGVLAGLLSALALAVFPSFVAVGRDNTLDSLLILLTLLACGLALRAIESGRTRTLVLSALVVGVAFNTKSLAALLCVPGIGVGYLVCAPGAVRRRIGQLALAGAVLVVVAASWSLAVELTPASQRPYVGGSTNNSEFQLEFGYNGFGRVGGQAGGPGTLPPSAVTDVPLIRTPNANAATPVARIAGAATKTAVKATGPVRRTMPIPFPEPATPSPVRIFRVGLGDQAGWIVPLAVIGMLGILFVLSGRRDRRTGVWFVLGGWFATELAALDFSKGIVHPYYASALGPGLAAMAGAGAAAVVWLVRRDDPRKALVGIGLAVLATVTTALVELKLIDREDYPHYWRLPLVVLCVAGLVALVLWRRRAGWIVTGLVLVLLVAPGLYSHSVWDAPVDGTFPTAGPYNDAGYGGIDVAPGGVDLNKAMAAYLRTHDATKRFTVLTESSDSSSPLILLGLHAAAMGGYNTTDPALSADGLATLVADGEARYVALGGSYWDRGGNAAITAARLVCQPIPQASWDPAQASSRAFYLVDCAGRAAALRRSYAVAEAYLRAHPRTLKPVSPSTYQDTSGLPTDITAQIMGGAGGRVTVAIGSTLSPAGKLGTLKAGRPGPAQTLYAALGASANRTLEFRLPAYWYLKITVAGSAAIASVTQR
jgi:4-amino-4-deoxy-L-arabinose transferase-like glycosyltransferase